MDKNDIVKKTIKVLEEVLEDYGEIRTNLIDALTLQSVRNLLVDLRAERAKDKPINLDMLECFDGVPDVRYDKEDEIDED